MKPSHIVPTILFLIALCPLLAQADKAPPDITLAAHGSRVLDLAFSPDGKRLATVGDDGLLKVWDLAGKKEAFSVNGARNNSNQVRFTPDGKTVLAMGSENNVIVFEADTGKSAAPIALPAIIGGASAIDLSPDGKTLAVVGRGTLCLLDFPSGKQKASYEVHKGYGVVAVAFSPNGTHLATVSSDKTAALIDAATGKVPGTFKLGLVGVAVAFSRDGKTLFASSTDQVLRSFDISTGEAKTLVDKVVPIFALAVSNDGKSLVLAGPGHGPWIVALPAGTLADPAYDSEDWVKSTAISPDGKWLAGGANGGAVYLWKAGN